MNKRTDRIIELEDVLNELGFQITIPQLQRLRDAEERLVGWKDSLVNLSDVGIIDEAEYTKYLANAFSLFLEYAIREIGEEAAAKLYDC